jgi:negative regulator of sigma E activity
MGALNVYHREVHGHMVVVMGEVPVLSLKQFGDGIVWSGQ